MAGFTHEPVFTADNWQTKRRCIRERSEFLFNNKLLSDVSFRVGKEQGKYFIPGHKLILAISSPVFYAMFYGSMAEQKAEITVADSDADSFMELLRYAYFDEATINEENVLGVLYLAKKYILPFLADKCVAFLEQNIDHHNAFTLLSQARYYCEPKLEETCWELIEKDTCRVISSDDFTEVDHSTLLAVLSRETLTVTEAELFKAIKRWAEAECVRRELSPDDPKNKRLVLSGALNLVRFPVMSLQEFTDDAAVSGILTQEETINIFLYFGSKGATKVESFKSEPRRGTHRVFRCTRFMSDTSEWNCEGTNVDSIKFSVDRDIRAVGVGLYGICNPADGHHTEPYCVDLELLDSHNDSLRAFEGTYFPEKPEKVHDVIFDEPVLLEAHESYTIRVLLKGLPTHRGTEGKRDVLCEDAGVRFRFDVDEASFNGTTTADGQIPEVIFKLP
ncbi:predicted protein [Nematostella vectensis]|uniref:BTB domain-containing protein n=1 Tax=Nematostella vectensis TaxID=45351 RepID=A7RI13_NEMVE|nr:BTB/POZ domain-containing protein 2 [Nematostella vectensis]EDO48952.1 predicted protein [Nematostella vectensis]|eukprot:XP_001641015.1 predicted protein [Nematostella vectensis]